jgi:DNA-binding CsgD family transcriptional regulator
MSAFESPSRGEGSTLFAAAFTQSRNAMALLDERRCHVDLNGAYLALLRYPRRALLGRPVYEFVVGGPTVTPEQWRAALDGGRFTGETQLRCADGKRVAIQWAATTETMTGRRLVLFVALNTSRWGAAFRRSPQAERLTRLPLTGRELEVVRLVALGSSGPEIAEELRISHDTVRTHARNAMIKAGARSRAQLVAKAIGEGLILDQDR